MTLISACITCSYSLAVNYVLVSIGRSRNLSDFVKTGKESGFSEVDLLLKNSVVRIRRTINRSNNNSLWDINNEKATQIKVKELLKNLSIDMDNLCSFMPQDRVGHFSLLTPKELLQNTLQAVAKSKTITEDSTSSSTATASATPSITEFNIKSPTTISGCNLFDGNLYEEQQELATIEKTKNQLELEKENVKNSLTDVENQLKSMENDLQRLKKRETNKQLLEMYLFRRQELLCYSLTEQEQVISSDIDELSNRINIEKKKILPLQQRLRELEIADKSFEKKFQQRTDTAKNNLKEINNFVAKLDNYDINTENIASEIENFTRRKKAQENKLLQVQTDLQNTRNAYNQSVSTAEEAKSSLEEIKQHALQLKNQENDLLDDISEKRKQDDELRRSYNLINDEISNMQNFKQVYIEKLKNSQIDRSIDQDMKIGTIKAMEWLDENLERLRNNGTLKGDVRGPLAMYCDVQDPVCSAMIEKVIPSTRLLAFVTENEEDSRFLKNQFRNVMKLKIIDIVSMANTVLRAPQYSQQQYHNIVNSCPHLNVQGYLADQLQCPDIIRSCLYSFHGLQNVLWARPKADGNNAISTKDMSFICPDGIKGARIFVHEYDARSNGSNGVSGAHKAFKIGEYTGRRSNYTNNVSTSRNEIFPKNLLGRKQGGDDDLTRRKQEKEQQLKQIEADLNSIQKQIQEVTIKKNLISDSFRKIQADRVRYRNIIEEPRKYEQRMRQYQEKAKQLEKELSKDSDKERKRLQDDYEKNINMHIDVIPKLLTLTKTHYDVLLQKVIIDKSKDKYKRELQELRDKIDDFTVSMTNLQKSLDDKKKSKESILKELKELQKGMELIAQEKGDDFLLEVVENCVENSIDEVDDRVAVLTGEIQAVHQNDRLFQRAEELKNERERLTTKFNQYRERFIETQNSMEDRRNDWIDKVKNIAEKLSTRFSNYMEKLGNEGSVMLCETGNIDDYELLIKVKFRDNCEASVLSGTRHSGGERAVSTIMFLMALQTMTSSPFRVVDEINQGMDERNERLVVDRIVQSCTDKQTKSQYFLVTPKLLEALRSLDNDEVTVLTIFNGPGNFGHWQLSEIAESIRASKKRNQIQNGKNSAKNGKPSFVDFDADDESVIEVSENKSATILKKMNNGEVDHKMAVFVKSQPEKQKRRVAELIDLTQDTDKDSDDGFQVMSSRKQRKLH